MSICFDKDKKARWFMKSNEIACRIPVQSLSKFIDKQIAFDPKSRICVFKNGRELDAETVAELKRGGSSESILGILRNWFSRRVDNTGASITVLRNGRFFFDETNIDAISKDYAKITCSLSVSAEIVDTEKFAVNAFSESAPEYPEQAEIVARKARLEELMASLRKNKDPLNVQIIENSANTGFVFQWTKQNRQASKTIKLLEQKAAVYDEEISKIKKDIAELDAEAARNRKTREEIDCEYYTFTSECFYRQTLQALIHGLVLRTVSEKDESELLQTDLAAEVTEKLASVPRIANHIADLGVAVRIDSLRVVNERQARMIEQLAELRRETDERKWRVEFNKNVENKIVREELDFKREHDALSREADSIEKTDALKRSEADADFKKSERSINVDLKRSESEKNIEEQSIAEEEKIRVNSILNAAERLKLESDVDKKFFAQELKRRELIKDSEFQKLEREIDWAQADAQTERETKKESEKIDTENTLAEKRLRGKMFLDNLATTLGLDGLKAKADLEKFEFERMTELAGRKLDYELARDRKVQDFADEKRRNELGWEEKLFDSTLDRENRKRRSDSELSHLEDEYSDARTHKNADWEFADQSRKFARDDEREFNRRKFDEELADNSLRRSEFAADSQFKRQEEAKSGDRRHQSEMFSKIQEAELRRKEADRLEKKDQLLKELEETREKEATERAKKELEIAHLTSDDLKIRYQKEAMHDAMQKMMDDAKAEKERILREAKEEAEYKRRMEEEERKFRREREIDNTAHSHDIEMARARFGHSEKMAESVAKISEEKAKRDFEIQEKQMSHEEKLADINSGERVAQARMEEKDKTIEKISDIHQQTEGKPKTESKMVCDKCNRYFPAEFAVCPLCGGKLRKVEL